MRCGRAESLNYLFDDSRSRIARRATVNERRREENNRTTEYQELRGVDALRNANQNHDRFEQGSLVNAGINTVERCLPRAPLPSPSIRWLVSFMVKMPFLSSNSELRAVSPRLLPSLHSTRFRDRRAVQACGIDSRSRVVTSRKRAS